MATFNKFQDFVEQLGKGVHQLHAAGHTLKVYLTNDTPDAALDAVKADLAEITAQNGYPAGGVDIQQDYTEAGGTGTLTAVDVRVHGFRGLLRAVPIRGRLQRHAYFPRGSARLLVGLRLLHLLQ